MVNSLMNAIWAQYLKLHRSQIRQFSNYPIDTQWQQLDTILRRARNTEWGKRYKFGEITNVKQWQDRLPLQDYESLKEDIFRMMRGEKDILWPGRTKYFAKSSGTTADKSKFIPITDENHEDCHVKGGWRSVAIMYENLEDPRIVEGKTMVIPGSTVHDLEGYLGSIVGDVSAVILQRTPLIAQQRLFPPLEIALMSNFEEKLEIMVRTGVQEDIRMVAGSPTWALVLFKKVLEYTGKQNILEVWPNMQIFVHGAVSFIPYKAVFAEFFPDPKFAYQEIYNATEGYFGVQSDYATEDMLLILDNSIYYEFVPMEEWDKEDPKTILLQDVELNKHYALIITTNAGLFRYQIGDTVMFTCLLPYKIKVTGRTKQFINAFGEEVMVSNTDKALQETAEQFQVQVSDYTVAPIFQSRDGKGGHEWIIEFQDADPDREAFAEALDKKLQTINSDYEAKRFCDMAMKRLVLHIAPKNTFMQWLRQKNKVSAQQKVPRLSNHRLHLEEILQIL